MLLTSRRADAISISCAFMLGLLSRASLRNGSYRECPQVLTGDQKKSCLVGSFGRSELAARPAPFMTPALAATARRRTTIPFSAAGATKGALNPLGTFLQRAKFRERLRPRYGLRFTRTPSLSACCGHSLLSGNARAGWLCVLRLLTCGRGTKFISVCQIPQRQSRLWSTI